MTIGEAKEMLDKFDDDKGLVIFEFYEDGAREKELTSYADNNGHLQINIDPLGILEKKREEQLSFDIAKGKFT